MKRIIIVAAMLASFFSAVCAQEARKADDKKEKEVSYSEIRTMIDEGIVDKASVTNDGWWVTVRTDEGAFYYAAVTPQTPIADHLYEAGVPVLIEHYNEEPQEKADELPSWLSLLINILPLLLLLLFLGGIFVFSRKQTNNYYSRAENMQAKFLDRLEKLLTERKENNG